MHASSINVRDVVITKARARVASMPVGQRSRQQTTHANTVQYTGLWGGAGAPQKGTVHWLVAQGREGGHKQKSEAKHERDGLAFQRRGEQDFQRRRGQV